MHRRCTFPENSWSEEREQQSANSGMVILTNGACLNKYERMLSPERQHTRVIRRLDPPNLQVVRLGR
jgi:hypothetical protein